jgi:hypothetical protein
MRLYGSMEDVLYWIQPRQTVWARFHKQLYTRKDIPMTYMDIVFRYGAVPDEKALRAIDGMREVYGIRGVQFNEAERTVRVGYDGSRLKADAVAKLLRQAGVDVREAMALA